MPPVIFPFACQPRLVGGSTRMCAVQELVRKLVGGKELNQSVSWRMQGYGLWVYGFLLITHDK